MKPPNSVNSKLGRRYRYAFFIAIAITIGGAATWAQQAKDVQAASFSRLELDLKDFFKLPIGAEGLEISPALRNANGQVVTLTGYMVQQEVPTAGEFLLTPRPVQMSEHADGEADDLPPATVRVLLAPVQHDWVVPHVRGLIRITGVLSVGREEGLDGRVSWVRLQLAPDATRSTN